MEIPPSYYLIARPIQESKVPQQEPHEEIVQTATLSQGLENLHIATRAVAHNPDTTTQQPTIDRSHLQSISFETITRYLPDRQQLLAKQGRDQEIAQLSAYLQESNWPAILACYQHAQSGDLAMDALKMLRDGKLAIEPFCTLTYLDALFREFPGYRIQTCPLFNADGTKNQLVKNILDKSLCDYSPPLRPFRMDVESDWLWRNR